MNGMRAVKFRDETGIYDYQIPDIWLAGIMSRHPEATLMDVLRWWHSQAQLEKQWQAQQ